MMIWIKRTNSFMISINIFCILCFLFASACNSPKENTSNANFKQMTLDYAKDFSVKTLGDSILLTINTGKKDRNLKESFVLLKNTKTTGSINTIPIPCKRIICLSSTQLSYFFALDDIDDIIAINSSKYLYNKKMQQLISEGKVKKIGKEGHFQIETIAALNPDVIFVSPFKVGGFDVLRNMGIPLVPISAYNEKTPLGRAEWLKMVALFVGKEQKADSLFNGIKNRYNNLKAKCATVQNKPTVFSGKMRSGSWYVPGGGSFNAHFFRDAGADYFMKNNKENAEPLDFETVYAKAVNCDFWRIINPEKKGMTLNDLLLQDGRYGDFKAFKEKNVLLCNFREKPYHEQSAVKPDVLLSDYIYFFHPELVPNYEPFFYERLR